MRNLIVVLLALAFMGCAGSGPVGAAETAENVSVVSVITPNGYRPLGGVPVEIGGETFVTDSNGRVYLGAPLPSETAVRVLPSAVNLERFTTLERGTLLVWPRSLGVNEEFVGEIVFDKNPLLSLARLPRSVRSVGVNPSAEIRASADAMREVAIGAEAMAAGGIPYRIVANGADGEPVTSGHEDRVVDVVVDPDDAGFMIFPDAAALAYTEYDGVGEITAAWVVFRRIDGRGGVRSGTVAHELGHTRGLRHTSGGDTMSPGATVADFSPREVMAMRIQNDRRAKTRWLDDDRATATSSVVDDRRRTVVMVVD